MIAKIILTIIFGLLASYFWIRIITKTYSPSGLTGLMETTEYNLKLIIEWLTAVLMTILILIIWNII